MACLGGHETEEDGIILIINPWKIMGRYNIQIEMNNRDKLHVRVKASDSATLSIDQDVAFGFAPALPVALLTIISSAS